MFLNLKIIVNLNKKKLYNIKFVLTCSCLGSYIISSLNYGITYPTIDRYQYVTFSNEPKIAFDFTFVRKAVEN